MRLLDRYNQSKELIDSLANKSSQVSPSKKTRIPASSSPYRVPDEIYEPEPVYEPQNAAFKKTNKFASQRFLIL
jgi:hypothetical protein